MESVSASTTIVRSLHPLSPIDRVSMRIYLHQWQRVNGGVHIIIDEHSIHNNPRYINERYPVFGMFHGRPDYPTQRDCQVISSFLAGLGSGGYGQEYLSQAQRLAETLKAGGDESGTRLSKAYRWAWLDVSERKSGSNHDLTVPEHITMKKVSLTAPGRQLITQGVDYDLALDLSARDMEMMVLAAGWLGTPMGQKYLERCAALQRYLSHRSSLKYTRSLPLADELRARRPRLNGPAQQLRGLNNPPKR